MSNFWNIPGIFCTLDLALKDLFEPQAKKSQKIALLNNEQQQPQQQQTLPISGGDMNF